jgi:hypothetical protein
MSRLIFVPQYPTTLRYQSWWMSEFPNNLKKYFHNIHVLGTLDKLWYETKEQKGMFSPIKSAIDFELTQIEEYMDLELQDDDILFVADLSFPGFFINCLYHKRPKRCYAFCHATSINHLDYFEKVRGSKFLNECAHSYIFDKIFIGSKYHQKVLGWSNTIVTRLPKPPFPFDLLVKKEKIYDIVSASRPTPQKVDKELEEKIEKEFGKIVRYEPKAWHEYYSFLSQAKICLVTAKEETFGYQVMDAILAGTIPICPNRLSYPELLDRTYLYNDFYELKQLLTNFLEGIFDYKVPELLCNEECNNFYDTIGKIMKGE